MALDPKRQKRLGQLYSKSKEDLRQIVHQYFRVVDTAGTPKAVLVSMIMEAEFGRANPGAAWHETEIIAAEIMEKKHPELQQFFRGKQMAHKYSKVISRARGMPNPSKKRRRSKKKTTTPLLVIGGVLVTAYFLSKS